MKTDVIITFKDGKQIYCEPRKSLGCWSLVDGLSLNVFSQTVYKQVGNVVCGEDITDQVLTIGIFTSND